jgi:hypothetical protein
MCFVYQPLSFLGKGIFFAKKERQPEAALSVVATKNAFTL